MDYLKQLKFPLTMSGLLFGASVLVFLRIDFYAVILILAYLTLASISSLGNRYLTITGQSKSAKAILKMFVETPATFLLLLGLFYVFTGSFHWIFIVTSSFITFAVFGLAFSDWYQERENKKSQNEN